VRLFSRSGYTWTKRLVGLAEALAGIRCTSAVIDVGMHGRMNFSGMM